MGDTIQDPPWVDGAAFIENVNRIPPELQLQYAGMHVAYSLDGTQILAKGKDYAELDRNLIAAGIDPQRVVHAYIPAPDEHTLVL